jgi:predicted ArsR family transcriptional regulator
MLSKAFFETTRGRIVVLLRRGARTVDDVAAELELTSNAVRAHITGMQNEGIVRRVGQRPGATRPSYVFELSNHAEQLLSRAYIPFLTQVVQTVAKVLPTEGLDRLMREAGQALGHELTGGKRLAGGLRTRVLAASDLMNHELGALTHVEQNGRWRIIGLGCPLAVLTGKHPAVCRAIESLLMEVLQTPVRECCNRSGRPRCCFDVPFEKNTRPL